MALPSAFQERLQQMEATRNERLSLLQAEKELQRSKSQILSAKLSKLRCAERRCLLLERRRAEVRFQILARKAEIEAIEARYQSSTDLFRVLKCRTIELEEKEKTMDQFYETKTSEMGDFKELVRRRILDFRSEAQNLRVVVSELRSTLKELQERDGCVNNPELAAAERRKAELLTVEESLQKTLASNIQLRSSLQKQLQRLLSSGADGGQTTES
ncbi:unnamed protein product [Spirodela intermedia]|uniref:Uncharacterized protein n=2 Tax=Spirodela intermedia TaxID=51605 RepID=A0A7I8J5U6_SPIIN|nr:unnamed protein product [Spirodela intermedia]CAA6665606.1 unnamed protein product [Spirodela intermedia]CAA7402339.1 unnamed protein product [Spirodela intermedia]